MKYPQSELFEQLSSVQHDIWADWQKYLHSKMKVQKTARGHIIYFPTELWQQWERQIKTPYSQLTEKEKDSDREQVLRYWTLFKVIEF